VAAAIVTSWLGVLISRRVDRNPPWSYITGRIEPGESPAAAAVREVAEETGLVVSVGEVLGSRIHPATGRHLIYVSAEPVSGTEVSVRAGSGLSAVRWASLAEAEALMPGMFPPVRAYLARMLAVG
jgi:8-oxo-dGTP diphosphatase